MTRSNGFTLSTVARHPAKRSGKYVEALHSGVSRMTLVEAAAVLESYRHRGAPATLERMSWLCQELGHPERVAPAVHMTGTNGKGSTTKLVAALLQASGLRVGHYVSPHLLQITERIGLDGRAIPDGEFCSLVDELAPLFDRAPEGCGQRLTHFDALTAMALVAFDRWKPDVLAVEVGIGGRRDATNVVDGRVALITNVDLDHTQLLGATEELIAEEKVGIIKPGAVAVLGEPTEAVDAVFRRRCSEVGATAWVAGRDIHVSRLPDGAARVDTPGGTYRVRVPFAGPHQARNAACALAGAEAFLGGTLPASVVDRAWRELVNPGHFEVLGEPPGAVVDVAHNPHGVRALVAALEDAGWAGRHVVVFSAGRDKDARAMLERLRPLTATLVLTQAPPDAPSRSVAELAELARSVGFAHLETEADPARAVRAARELAAPGELVVCTGSHYWIGAVYQLLLDLFGAPVAGRRGYGAAMATMLERATEGTPA